LIKFKGFQVAPAELEATILEHPRVIDVAVVGKPDLESGELPIAFVVLRENQKATTSEIIEWSAQKLAPHKKLRGVIFVNQIPKSPSGKILRRVLRDELVKMQPHL